MEMKSQTGERERKEDTTVQARREAKALVGKEERVKEKELPLLLPSLHRPRHPTCLLCLPRYHHSLLSHLFLPTEKARARERRQGLRERRQGVRERRRGVREKRICCAGKNGGKGGKKRDRNLEISSAQSLSLEDETSVKDIPLHEDES
mmetsp:Transcript_19805/g.28027  ORF Transcript_19805/g.28027 Transcript_19805/m.28027 type:complete len:149 (+) Transcript_19805:3472-3918(+)